MAGKKKVASPVHLNEYDRQYLKETIEQAGGCEVLSAAVCPTSAAPISLHGNACALFVLEEADTDSGTTP